MSASETVWVAELETTTGAGWTSVHRTREAAERRLFAKLADWGISHLESREVASWGLGEYPVED